MQMSNFKKLNKKNNLPDKPGVYFFLKGKEILYIGKATSLKDRVKSYFGKDLIETRGPIILDMVFKADRIEYQVTDSVLEALILEANLIKKHQPKYNTKEKSDKSFNYVCITKEKLPRVIIVRGRNLQGGRFLHGLAGGGTQETEDLEKASSLQVSFGPFTNGPALREALKIIRKIFPFLDDKSKNYLEFYRQINLVPDLNDTKMYLENIKKIKLFFSGKKKEIFRNLKKEMQDYAKLHEFEKAGEIKRQLFSLQHINDVALIKNSPHPSPLLSKERGNSTFRIEAYDVAHMGGKNMVGVMVVVSDGEVEKSEYKKFKIRTQDNANDTGALKEILERRLAHAEWTYPNLIVVDGAIAQINIAKKVLKGLKINIPIVSVVKDDRHKAKAIMGPAVTKVLAGEDEDFAVKYKREILLANSEAHRFAISYHKNMRNRNFLK